MDSDDDRNGTDRSATDARGQWSGDEVMAAYDRIEGESAFVIAALDEPRAWIAVPDGVELDVEEWN